MKICVWNVGIWTVALRYPHPEITLRKHVICEQTDKEVVRQLFQIGVEYVP